MGPRGPQLPAIQENNQGPQFPATSIDQGRRHGGGKGGKRPPPKYLGGASPPLTPS